MNMAEKIIASHLVGGPAPVAPGDAAPPTDAPYNASAGFDEVMSLSVADPVRLLGYLFGSDPRLPQPFDVCGRDPTGDTMGCELYGMCP